MATKSLGRVSIVPQGDYDENQVYKRLDLVKDDGKTYLSLKEDNTSLLADEDSWMLLTESGRFEDLTPQELETLLQPLNESIEDANQAAEAANEAAENALTGISGEATQSNSPEPTGFHRYIVTTPITAGSTWGVAVTQAELNDNWVFFNVKDGVITKELKPIQTGRGITSISKTSTVGEVDTYTITFSDSTTSTFSLTNGTNAKLPLYSAIKSANIAAGTQFIDDENGNVVYRVKTGQTLLTSELPANVVGSKVEAAEGLDAYQTAVRRGFAGTYAQWLSSLVGPQGTIPAELTAQVNIAIADSAEALGIAEDVRDEFNQIIADGDSSAEVVQARAGETTLNVRLNKLDEKKASLALEKSMQRVPMSMNVSSTGSNRKPFITFVDDDGFLKYYDQMAPMLEAKGWVGCPAIITGDVTGATKMKVHHLLELQNRGHEMLSHTVDHFSFGSLTPDQIEHQCKVSKEMMINWGLHVDSIIYPFGQYNGTAGLERIKKYYRSGFTTNNGANNNQIRSLGNAHAAGRIDISNTTTLIHLKEQVDICFANSSWIVFMVHCSAFNATGWQLLADLLDYIELKGVSVGTIAQGLEMFGNSFDVGNKNFIRLTANGEFHHNAWGTQFRNKYDGYDVSENTPLSFFQAEVKTISVFPEAYPGVFPERNVGELETFASQANPLYSYQLWKPRDRENVYRRFWNGTYTVGTWGAWRLMGVNIGQPNSQVVNTPYSDIFGQIALAPISTAAAVGLPVETAGTMLFIDSQKGTGANAKQIFMPNSTNDIYLRSFRSNGTTTEFERFVKAKMRDFTLPAQSLAIGASVTVDVNIVDLVGNNFLSARMPFNVHTSDQATELFRITHHAFINAGILKIVLKNTSGVAWTMPLSNWHLIVFS